MQHVNDIISIEYFVGAAQFTVSVRSNTYIQTHVPLPLFSYFVHNLIKFFLKKPHFVYILPLSKANIAASNKSHQSYTNLINITFFFLGEVSICAFHGDGTRAGQTQAIEKNKILNINMQLK